MTYTDQNAERHGVIRLDAPEPCARCGESAEWASISLETPVCGPNCHTALWSKHIPADDGRTLSIWAYTSRADGEPRRRAVVEAWDYGRLLFTLTVDAERLVELVQAITREMTREEEES